MSIRDFLNPENARPVPLVELPDDLNPLRPVGVRVFAKLMYLLPLLSIKSLPALNMLLEAERAGDLAGIHTVVENSSGNTAFSVSVMASLFGIRKAVALVPWDIASGKLDLLRLMGVEPHLKKEADNEPSGIAQARAAGKEKGFFNPAQYDNPANPAAYEKWMAPEIWRQTDGLLSVFASSLGTTGTLVGSSQYFRAQAAKVSMVAALCRAGHAVPGVRSEARLAEIAFQWRNAADFIAEVETKVSYKTSVNLCRNGLLAGPSSGLALAGLMQYLDVQHKSGTLDQLRNKCGEVLSVFICGDTPLPYLEKYSTHLDPSDF